MEHKQTIDIRIWRDKYGSLFAFENGNILFQFERRSPACSPNGKTSWLFWLRDDYHPAIIEGRTFPKDFFIEACRAKAFIRNGYDAIPEAARIVDGGDLVGL